jgi:hypothetical protein
MKTDEPNRNNITIINCKAYRNYFIISFQSKPDGEPVAIELIGEDTRLSGDECKAVYKLLRSITTIGFNSLAFDLPLIAGAIEGRTCRELWEISVFVTNYYHVNGTRVIEQYPNSNRKIPYKANAPYVTRKKYGIEELKIPHIDIMPPSPARDACLKGQASQLHLRSINGLDVKHDTTLTREQMAEAKKCCANDLQLIDAIYSAVKARIDLRFTMSNTYNLRLWSKEDAGIAEDMMRSKLGVTTPGDIPSSASYTSPPYIKFSSPMLNKLLTLVNNLCFRVDGDSGNLITPKEIDALCITIGNTSYTFGVGGLHSLEKAMVVVPDDSQLLLDRDVTSYYPTLILNLGLYPEKLGQKFLDEYGAIVDERVKAKRAGNGTVNASLKIVINGTFGKLSSKYSVVYSPELLLAVTLTGQLSLLMLIERLEASGISVVSANTDGVASLLNASDRDKFNAICDQWEHDTSLGLEETEYKALYARDVNNYRAVTIDGNEKRKGVFATTCLGAYPANAVAVEAVIKFIDGGHSLTSSIISCTDIRQFLRAQTVNGGATWNDKYIGDFVRFYYSTGGMAIKTAPTPDGKTRTVPYSPGSRPLSDLPDILPADINYAAYAMESLILLDSLGLLKDDHVDRETALLTELGLLNGVNLQKDVDAKRKTRARDIAASVRKRTLLESVDISHIEPPWPLVD